MKWAYIIFSLLFASFSTFAADKGAAKAIIVKGKVVAVINGKKVALKRGMWLPEGSVVQTQKRSFTKLLFIDKSSMNVGPESKMKIDSFPKKDAGIITLIKGQIRSKVTKNYMDIKKKNKSKLFIKTETAAMGVRGTDFIVSFNPVNKATSLITFEGAVAMARMPKGKHSQRSLERAVSAPTAVIVKKGQYSGATNQSERATIPVKISPTQIETLEKNEVPGVTKAGSKKSQKSKKTFKSIVPPGVDPMSVANDSTEVSSSMASAIGQDKIVKVDTEIKNERTKAESYAQDMTPATNHDSPTELPDAPKSGGIIDLKSASYIAPPEGAAFDSNSGTFVMPTEMGFVNSAGDFDNKYYEVTQDGTMKKKKVIATTNRAPANADGTTAGNSSSQNAGGDDVPPPPPIVAVGGAEGPAPASDGTNLNNVPNNIIIIPTPPPTTASPQQFTDLNQKTRAKFILNTTP
jgi:hypothetical protein